MASFRILPRRASSFLPTALLLATALAGPATAATFTVTSTGDQPLNTGNGTCNVADGGCTLRAALTVANTTAGPHTINFNIPGAGPHVIAPATALPTATKSVFINGYSQPGASTNTLAVGNNASIRIHLDGRSAAITQGLALHGDDSNVRGLAIYGFSGAGLRVQNGIGITLAGNFIGTDGSGSAQDSSGALGNQIGIVAHSDNLTIGGPQPADRNLIVGRNADDAGNAILIRGRENTALKNALVQGNYISTNRAGTQRFGTRFGVQIDVNTQDVRLLDNVIGARAGGIVIDGGADRISIQGNRIGVGADDVSPIATNPSTNSHGILINGNSSAHPLRNIYIGGPLATQRNHIAHWGGDGIRIRRQLSNVPAMSGHVIRGNRIHSNGLLGIELIDTTTNQGIVPGGEPTAHINGGVRVPTLTSATLAASQTQIGWQLSGMPTGGNYELEVFANTACDASGCGEGMQSLGSFFVSVNASGAASGTHSLPALPQSGNTVLTMTATHHLNSTTSNTSEFSACRTLGDVPPNPQPVDVLFADDFESGGQQNLQGDANTKADTFAVAPQAIAASSPADTEGNDDIDAQPRTNGTHDTASGAHMIPASSHLTLLVLGLLLGWVAARGLRAA